MDVSLEYPAVRELGMLTCGRAHGDAGLGNANVGFAGPVRGEFCADLLRLSS